MAYIIDGMEFTLAVHRYSFNREEKGSDGVEHIKWHPQVSKKTHTRSKDRNDIDDREPKLSNDNSLIV